MFLQFASPAPALSLLFVHSLLPLLLFGCLTGVTTVLFGFGGGFLTVPVVYGLRTVGGDPAAGAMHVAVATSSAVMLVNAASAAVAQHRQGRLRREYVWPLAAFVGLGAAAGAWAATLVDDAVLHLLFIGYLLVTIVDCLLRRGFLAPSRTGGPAPLGLLATRCGGFGIGAVAACLGVGGSVLTVPLLRRRGLPMAQATATANPLSVPVAAVGTLVYLLAPAPAAGPGGSGAVDVAAALALLTGSLPAIALTRRIAGRVPDRVHSAAYPVLLVVVLGVMLLTGR